MNESLTWIVPDALLNTVGYVLWILGTLGVISIIYIAFSLVNAIINRKRNQEIKRINENLEEIKLILRKKSP